MYIHTCIHTCTYIVTYVHTCISAVTEQIPFRLVFKLILCVGPSYSPCSSQLSDRSVSLSPYQTSLHSQDGEQDQVCIIVLNT